MWNNRRSPRRLRVVHPGRHILNVDRGVERFHPASADLYLRTAGHVSQSNGSNQASLQVLPSELDIRLLDYLPSS